jgi:hypothetical protein
VKIQKLSIYFVPILNKIFLFKNNRKVKEVLPGVGSSGRREHIGRGEGG